MASTPARTALEEEVHLVRPGECGRFLSFAWNLATSWQDMMLVEWTELAS